MATKKKLLPSGMGEFPLDVKMKKPARIAAFLNWWAEKSPKQYVAYNQLLQVVEGYKDLPSAKSPEVKAIRNQVRNAEATLDDIYDRGVIRHRWFGVRASADPLDRMKNRYVRRARNLRNAIISTEKEAGKIDISKIPNSPEAKPYKDWFKRSTSDILGLLNQPRFMDRLLPHFIDEKKEDLSPADQKKEQEREKDKEKDK